MNKNNIKKAVVLVSGGLDSTTVLAIASSLNYEIYAITFDYGQRHNFELEAARKIAEKYQVTKHIIQKIDLRKFGGSSLTTNDPVPLDREEDLISHSGIPSTYVPARNTVFLSLALAWAETIQAHEIFIGVNSIDYSGYPDCRPEFIEAFEKMANLATKEGVLHHHFKIQTPLINLTKAQIISKGTDLGVDYKETVTCYAPPEPYLACGRCDACKLRKNGFKEAKTPDPTKYMEK